MRPAALLMALLVLGGCKSKGDISLMLDFPAECETTATHVQVYLIHGAACAECRCGDCLIGCSADNCTLGCADGVCPISALDEGLVVTPPRAGTYAIIYQLLATRADGRMEEVALTCADGVQLDKDGTSSSEAQFSGECCTPSAAGPDAGADDANSVDSGS